MEREDAEEESEELGHAETYAEYMPRKGECLIVAFRDNSYRVETCDAECMSRKMGADCALERPMGSMCLA